LKRQFAIRDGHIRLLFDTGVTIGDELLQRVLSRNTDMQMKAIVATIQKEQNQIIRDDTSRLIIVQGPAGSGKTSAALQRVAYLLYKHRNTLRADQMLLFSPNPLFNSYVSSVLPELGEENMQQTTFQEYLEHRLGGRFQLEDPFDSLESMLEGNADDVRMEGIRYKSSRAFFDVILAYRDRLLHEGMIFRPMVFRNETIVSAEAIRDQFYAYDASVRLLNRIELLRDWLLAELDRFETQQLGEAWVDEEMQYLSAEEVHRSYQEFRRTRKNAEFTFDDFAKERDIAAQLVVKKHLAPVRTEMEQMGFVDVTALYRQLFSQPALLEQLTDQRPAHWQAICRSTLERLERGELAYEDATPYLFLQELVQGFETNPSIRHVLIDEVQDYSPFQLEYIKRLFPRARMTVLGDLNQAIFAHASAFDEGESLYALYGPEQSRVYKLTKSYRSNREIVEFTRHMIPGGEEIIPFERSGETPRVVVAADRGELHERMADAISKLREEGYESIGIITKTAAESEEAYEALNGRAEVQLITKKSIAYEKGALLLPVYLAKGVEFDAVIVYNGSAERYGQESDRKLFYTACTRAMHALHIFSVGEPSPFIRG
jgi:DNA helicase-2/ATP-dependent DNA helicase PcrA